MDCAEGWDPMEEQGEGGGRGEKRPPSSAVVEMPPPSPPAPLRAPPALRGVEITEEPLEEGGVSVALDGVEAPPPPSPPAAAPQGAGSCRAHCRGTPYQSGIGCTPSPHVDIFLGSPGVLASLRLPQASQQSWIVRGRSA